MAGLLQYYFFPTDFFYPKPQSVTEESSLQQAVPLGIQTQNPKQDLKMNDDVEKKTNSLTVRQTRRNVKLIKNSALSLKLRKPLYPKPAADSVPN